MRFVLRQLQHPLSVADPKTLEDQPRSRASRFVRQTACRQARPRGYVGVVEVVVQQRYLPTGGGNSRRLGLQDARLPEAVRRSHTVGVPALTRKEAGQLKRYELLAMIAVAIALGIVGTVATFGVWTLMPWAAVLLAASFFVEVVNDG